MTDRPTDPGFGKVPKHASIARRQQGILVGRKEKHMKNVLWKYEKKRFFNLNIKILFFQVSNKLDLREILNEFVILNLE